MHNPRIKLYYYAAHTPSEMLISLVMLESAVGPFHNQAHIECLLQRVAEFIQGFIHEENFLRWCNENYRVEILSNVALCAASN